MLDDDESCWAADGGYEFYSTMYFCVWVNDKWLDAEGRSSGEQEACFMAEMTMERYIYEGALPCRTKEDTASMDYDEKKEELLGGIGFYQECDLYQHHVENHPYEEWPEYIVNKIFDSDTYNKAWTDGYDGEFLEVMQREIDWVENARFAYVAALFNSHGLAFCGNHQTQPTEDDLVGRRVVVKREKGRECTGFVAAYNKRSGRHTVQYDEFVQVGSSWSDTLLCVMSKKQYRVLPKLKLHPVLCRVMDLAAPVVYNSDSDTDLEASDSS